MKRTLWLVIAALVVASAAVGLVALGRDPEVTTASPEALLEFEAALDARMKLYQSEARSHLEKAVELDPDFVLAKVLLAEYQYDNPELREQLLADVAAADLDRLSPRERFLAQRALAFRDKDYEEAAELLGAYLATYPDDPWVLNIKADMAWKKGKNEVAERAFRRLIEVSPNWVFAYNMMGYITMAQGRFEEAEEYFTSYRFIAPDQANPHDSLGELFIVTGRYDQAVDTLEEALKIKPDFWASYDHLVMVSLLRRDFDAARSVIERAASSAECPEEYLARMQCNLEYAEALDTRQWRPILDRLSDDPSCVGEKHGINLPLRVSHYAACALGEFGIAETIENDILQVVAKKMGSVEAAEEDIPPALLHLQGVRLAAQGKLQEAEQRFRQADDKLVFDQATIATFKLTNQLSLVESLFAQQRDAEAHQLLTKVRVVNATMAADFEQRGLTQLGISTS